MKLRNYIIGDSFQGYLPRSGSELRLEKSFFVGFKALFQEKHLLSEKGSSEIQEEYVAIRLIAVKFTEY